MADSHAVCRSTELLSCARTAVKIAKARGETWAEDAVLNLAVTEGGNRSGPLEDGVTLLRTMDAALEQLDTLVKRRGHTNDPTVEINSTVASLEEDAKEMSVWIQSVMPICTGQRQKHWKSVQEWFQKFTQHQNAHLKRVLEIRGNVLAEQAKRRQRFQSNAPVTRTKFQLPPPPPRKAIPPPPPPPPSAKPLAPVANGTTPAGSNGAIPHSETVPLSRGTATNGTATIPASQQPMRQNGHAATNGNSTVAPPIATASDPYESYYTPSAGYGGGMTMRQRRGGQQVLQDRRQTAQRVDEALSVEQSVAELSQVFGKMSHVIASQSETLMNIEDDVEAAHMDVIRGQEQIGILYEIRKGNRPLILKTYALLIFLIVFMRLYTK